MPTTTNAALRYPASSAAPNVPQDIQNLAVDVDTAIGATGSWTAYTPTWSTSGTGAVQPTVGNGTMVAEYRKKGREVTFNIDITFGSTTSGGVGAMTLSLPFQARSGRRQIVPLALDTNNPGLTAQLFWTGHARIDTSATAATLLAHASGSVTSALPVASATGSATVGTGNPTISGQFTFGSNSRITVTGTYQSAT